MKVTTPFRPRDPFPPPRDFFDQRAEPAKQVEIPLGDGRILVLDGD